MKLIWTLLLLISAHSLFSQNIIPVSDADLQGGTTVHWTKNNTYVLDGLVFLEEGGTLHIEPGTIVKFTPRADVGNPSALVITRGAQIFAEGTPTEPIIFTAEIDNVADPSDLGPTDNALWGGLVILGKGVTQKNGNATVNIEGIDTSEPRGSYGGTDNADNSGVLKYVSIRHGGRLIVSGSELNGLSLGAVGSGTTLEYIEVYANSDDGIEFFGGAPNLKHAVVAFSEDDSFDWDEVYTGKGQFWFSIQRADIADSGGELDGTTPDDLTPYSNPTVYNWTHIGAGPGATASNPLGLLFRAGTAGTVANSIITEMKNKAIEVQDKDAGANDAHQKLVNGELKIINNLFWNNGSNTTLDASATGMIRVTSGQPNQDDADASDLIAHLIANNSVIADPGIRSVSRDQDKNLDPRPLRSGASYTNTLAAFPDSDGFFTHVNFAGAFSSNPDQLWIAGWTALDRNGHLKDLSAGGEVINIVDGDLIGGQVYNWTKNNTYILDGLVFLEEGGVLNIEPGTVVKFTPRADVGNPSALVITRGAKIYAEGTLEEPIIFTAEIDDVADPTDLGPTDNALWGGLVILGNGITQKNGNATVNIEGIDTSEPRGSYGGTDNADNSGVLKYVSIRHGGRLIVSGSELNGLSLGAVGSGTTLEYIEVYANSDDGIEFFGGAPNLKHAVVAFTEDDSFDWDEVYTGQGQFWFSIQRADIADSGGELDGTTPDDLTPYSNPTVFNWTHIGAGPGATASNPLGLLFRAGTAGTVANSIITEMKNKALEVQDKDAGANDAHQKLLSGELKISGNLFWNNGSNTTLDASSTGIIRVTSGQPNQDDPDASDLIAHLIANNSVIADPGIRSVSRDQDENLDPRPLRSGAAYTNTLTAYPANPFFTEVNYAGAFSSNLDQLWVAGWTALERNGHLKDLTTGGEDIFIVDADLEGGGNVYDWTKNNTYILDGLVFLEEGGTLNIEAGTTVKFTSRADVGNPSALVITRGSKIYAEGTLENPIIFTAEADDVTDPSDLGPTDNALWGGIVILGNGVTQKNGNATVNIEGIDTSEPRGSYGGTDNGDNSGILKYVSIRHGGRQIVSGSELNGLSLGAVGSGTTLEYVEVYANSDDGIEFFGGAPNLKHAVVAFTEDDSYDWDEVYTGKGQFWFSIQRADIADSGGELDGTTPDDLTPYSNPTVYNWTHIGAGPGATASNPLGLLFRAGTAGTVANSIITEMKNKAIEVQDKDAGANDAHQKLVNGELIIASNLFWNNGSNTTLDATTTGIIRVTSGQPNQDDPDASDLIAHLIANNSTIADPVIKHISRDQDNTLDPRPSATGAAYTNPVANYPQGDLFFDVVNYAGAFSASSEEFWIGGWTTLERNGHLADPTVATEEPAVPEIADQYKVYPNPITAGSSFTIEANTNTSYKISLHNQLGVQVTNGIAQLNRGTTEVNVKGLPAGIYYIKFVTEQNTYFTKKLIIQ